MPVYAAIDIGSNSVKMLCAEASATGVTRVLVEERKVTRIGQSVFSEGAINSETLEMVSEVLAQMRASYQAWDPVAVRVVATSAVRDARNQEAFLQSAHLALGMEVEIISGLEEARLVHLGVVSHEMHPPKRALLIDVGGGSAEFIVSEDGAMGPAFSKPLGAVRLWQTFLTQDPPTDAQLHQLDEFIDEKIGEAKSGFGDDRFEIAIGTSASAFALVCAALGIPRINREQAAGLRVSREQVEAVYLALRRMSLADRRRVTGIGPRRAEIVVPGVALFRRAMDAFDIGELTVSRAGVREGIIVDLARRGVGKERLLLNDDQRCVVRSLSERFGIASRRGQKVAELAVDLFAGLRSLHRLPHAFCRALEAAAYLMDTGHYVSATKHHKHGFYLVSNVDLPGFTVEERRLVALLCRYHRKAMPSASHPEFVERPEAERNALLLLIPLLRLADALDRSKEQRVQQVFCRIGPQTVTLQVKHNGTMELECWAVQGVSSVFRSIYRRSLELETESDSGLCRTLRS